ncbi:hypothetical protein FH972_022105 [Carpinus fangiana]|uniref:Uncharacterized protein n=1 Tax=Carpinus fangiana TaxID=176857 RepID=A0A5N6KRM0_9ROSI|nr:hypothetical protein FH972_022105 [Carpinus fangiana]
MSTSRVPSGGWMPAKKFHVSGVRSDRLGVHGIVGHGGVSSSVLESMPSRVPCLRHCLTLGLAPTSPSFSTIYMLNKAA